MVVDGRPREHRPAQHGPLRTNQQSKENNRFKGDVGGQEVGHRNANPHAQRERHQEKRQQRQSLCGTALLGKEEPPEGGNPRQHTGHRSHHAQLHQQGNQNQIVGHRGASRCSAFTW